MAVSTNKKWRGGQTSPGMATSGKERDSSGTAKGKRKPADDDPDPKSVRFTPAEDADGNPAGYVGETEYDNSGDTPYKSPTTSIHTSEEDAGSHLAKTFGTIDSDESLDSGEKRRKKMKASLQVGKS